MESPQFEFNANDIVQLGLGLTTVAAIRGDRESVPKVKNTSRISKKPLGRPKILSPCPSEIPPKYILQNLPKGITFLGDKNGKALSEEKVEEIMNSFGDLHDIVRLGELWLINIESVSKQ